MNFEQHQTAYDRQLPDEPESTPMTYDSISNDNLWYIAEKLAEIVADQKTLTWRYCGNTHIVSDYTVIGAMIEDDTFARKLIEKSFADESTSGMVERKFNQVAMDEIYNHIVTSEEMPVGYDWSDFL